MTQSNIIGSETVNLLSPLLNLLPPEERRMLERSAELVALKRHEIIYREGESPNHLYLVVLDKVDDVGLSKLLCRFAQKGNHLVGVEC